MQVQQIEPSIWVTSDASGNWGCGAYGEEARFQFQWLPSMLRCHITIKELIPVVFAAAVWGHLWEGKSIRFCCDNVAVVAILRSGTSKDELIMHVMRCSAFITARFNFVVSASHIRGVDNTLADALSRDNAILFHSLHPQALPQATPIPPVLVELLSKPDWASQHWTRLWSSIFELHPPNELMLQLKFVIVNFVAYIVLHLSQFMNISYVNMCHFCQEVAFHMGPLNVTCQQFKTCKLHKTYQTQK